MANSSKSHFLISPYETSSIQIQNSRIKASSSEELPGIKIDSKPTCDTVNHELRVTSYELKA